MKLRITTKVKHLRSYTQELAMMEFYQRQFQFNPKLRQVLQQARKPRKL